MSFKYGRGVWVKDLVTGFGGCIIARMDNLTGCNRYAVQPEVDKDGKHQEPLWIDEHALEINPEKQQLKLERAAEQPPG